VSEPAPGLYSASELHPAIYDAMAASIPGGDDVAFYRSLAEQAGGPVVELGCGTGRVAIPLAEAGFDVTGIDRSAGMLARARMKTEALPPDVGALAALDQLQRAAPSARDQTNGELRRFTSVSPVSPVVMASEVQR